MCNGIQAALSACQSHGSFTKYSVELTVISKSDLIMVHRHCFVLVHKLSASPSWAQTAQAASGGSHVHTCSHRSHPKHADPGAQAELAEHLAAMGCCAACEPAGLLETLRRVDLAALVPYKKGGPAGIAAAIDRVMGFED